MVPARTVCNQPNFLACTCSRADRNPASKRLWKPICTWEPLFSTSVTTSLVPARSATTGFSQNTATPASAAARMRGACVSVGVAMTPVDAAGEQAADVPAPGHAQFRRRPASPAGVDVHHGELVHPGQGTQRPGVQDPDAANPDYPDPHCEFSFLGGLTRRREATRRRRAGSAPSWSSGVVSFGGQLLSGLGRGRDVLDGLELVAELL